MIQYLYLIGILHLIVCPFTKVEESFNLQAMHDIIYHKLNITEFDHMEFPGVVPRTFLGPLIITLLISPALTVIDILGITTSNKFICQYLVRAGLGCCVLYSYQKLYKTIKETFGDGVALWFFALTASQYHFMFYLSRPLPNIFALPLVLLAVNSWIKQDHSSLVCFSSAAVIIFRFELAIILGLMILIEIIKGNITFIRVMKIGVGSGLLSLMSTVAVDTFFWNRLIWPEGEVFWFNVILNKSSDYGVSPFFWYWYSALPRALGASVTLIPFGDRRTKLLIMPAIIFTMVMSFLPHKELRFIIYTFPLFNISAATVCNRMWMNRHKSMNRWIGSIFIVLHLVANVFISCILLKVASENYPGGQAISRLHKLVPKESDVHVYIDNLSAQTGVSRFTQLNDNWIYNKTENLVPGSADYYIFSHLLLEAKSKYSPILKPFSNTHEVMDVIEGFSNVHFNYNSFPPFKIKSKPMIFILKRNIMPKMYQKMDRKSNISFITKSSIIHKNDNIIKNETGKSTSSYDGTVIEIPEKTASSEIKPVQDYDNGVSDLNELQKTLEHYEMNLDDLFEDNGEKPLEINSKRIVANKIVRISTLKEKKKEL